MLFFPGVIAFAQTPPSAPAALPPLSVNRPAKDYEEAWTKVRNTITRSYYARKARKWEMESLLAKYAPLAKAAKSDQEFEDQVEAMIHEFGDSHFDFYTRSDLGYYVMDGLARGDKAESAPEIDAWFRKSTEGYTVQMLLEGGEAEKAGIRKGDTILSVDGAPFEPIASFYGKDGKKVSLTYSRGGAKFDKTVTPHKAQFMEMFLDATRQSAHVIDYKGKKLGYIHLWTQANDTFRAALEGYVTGSLANTDGFILDLRDGFGGRPERFADQFFRPGIPITWDYGSGPSTEHFGYDKPLVVLINVGSRSAKEILSYVLKKSKRATLIGTTTAGNVLGTSPIRIADWSILELPLVDVAVEGVRLEKNGVTPDIRVEDGYDKNGKDVVIQRAEEFLTGRRR